MKSGQEKRTEQRLRYHWPVWFADDYECGDLSQGQMADLSSTAAAFTVYAHERCPDPGQNLTARFSVPRYGANDSFDVTDFMRSGHVYRVDTVNEMLRRVVIQFAEPLPFKPGEQAYTRSAQPEPALI